MTGTLSTKQKMTGTLSTVGPLRFPGSELPWGPKSERTVLQPSRQSR